MTSMASAVSNFRAAHPRYRVTEENGAILVAPVSSPCFGPLARTLKDLALSGPAYIVGHDLRRMIDPSLPATRPMLGFSGPPQSISLLESPVSLYFQQLSYKAALDELVRQVPGLVWAFVEDQSPVTGRPRCMAQWVTPTGGAVSGWDSLSRGAK